MTQDELKETLCYMGYDDSILFESPSYTEAVIGISSTGQVCYSYEKMVDCLVNEDCITDEEAAEFIDYNTIRALPYYKPSKKDLS
ncbi:MAG: hypothetical protein J6Y37_13750 [Paludibacteraceae bacterium]|nr:hypothetical protein [Paludibacteraceae bacterium]